MFVGWYNPDSGPLFLQVRPMTLQPMIAVVGVLVSVSGCFFFHQCAKKVVSDSPGLADFATGLVKSVFNLPDGQVMFFEEFE